MADSKKSNKNFSRANSVTPAASVKKEDCSEEYASIGDTIEEYSDEGFDDEDGVYEDGDKRVRFRVGSMNFLSNLIFTIKLHFLLISHLNTISFNLNFFFSHAHTHLKIKDMKN